MALSDGGAAVRAKAKSGGAHTSRTMMLGDLEQLLASVPVGAPADAYREAIVEDNVLAKRSEAGRLRSHRYLRELYELDEDRPAFRALRRLWRFGESGRPLLALTSALDHDAALRGTAEEVLGTPEGATVTPEKLAGAVASSYPGSYGDAVAHKIGRNAASTWTQSGHLAGRSIKVRVRARPTPGSVAYALFIASLDGAQGELLFESLVVRAQDAPRHEVQALAREAARRSWIDYRSIGAVTEVGFNYLTEAPEHAA